MTWRAIYGRPYTQGGGSAGAPGKEKAGREAAEAAAAGGAAAPAAGAAGGASAVEVSSSQKPDEGLALKQNQTKTQVTVQNQAGWASMAADTVGPIGHCSPRRRVPFNSRCQDSKCVG